MLQHVLHTPQLKLVSQEAYTVTISAANYSVIRKTSLKLIALQKWIVKGNQQKASKQKKERENRKENLDAEKQAQIRHEMVSREKVLKKKIKNFDYYI